MTSINDTKSKTPLPAKLAAGLAISAALVLGPLTLSALNIIKATIITISTITGTEVTIAPLRWSIPAMAGTAITLRRR
jgi:hypothetical protein